MAVWSTLDFRELTPDKRFDAEFYTHPGFTLCRQFKSSGIAFDSVFRRVVHPGEFTRGYQDNPGRLFLRAQNVRPALISANDPLYVSEAVYASLPNARANANDLLLVRTGANHGDLARVPTALDGVMVSSHTLRLIPKDGAPVHALEILFASNSGRSLLLSLRSGGTHGQINAQALHALFLPELRPLEEHIKAIVLAVEAKREESTKHYTDAEAILTATLGLDRVDLAPRLFYEDTFAHAADAARLDAEYFSPRMQNVIETLSVGGKTIGAVAPLAKRRFKAVPGKPFDYIEIADIGTAGTVGNNSVPGEEAPSRATWVVKPGDIITTTVRPIRRLSAIILPEQDGFVCSSGFAVLRPRDIEPELLLTYLRLPLVAELLDLHTTASMYPAISTADLLRIPFRLPDAQACAKIVAKVRESFAARAESLRLLDKAKHTVEAAIMGEESQPKQRGTEG